MLGNIGVCLQGYFGWFNKQKSGSCGWLQWHFFLPNIANYLIHFISYHICYCDARFDAFKFKIDINVGSHIAENIDLLTVVY